MPPKYVWAYLRTVSKQVIICGGGAAGFFAAINIAEKHPSYKIMILEKTNKTLSKVKVSGGGRCNVTNARSKPSELVKFYPRGEKKLYKLFKDFSSSDMVTWLKDHGVATKSEEDLRMFPVSDDSQTIIDCFHKVCSKYNVSVKKNSPVKAITRTQENWLIDTGHEKLFADMVIVATGSSNQMWKVLTELGHQTVPPVPSLFTFNIHDKRLKELQGISFKDVSIKIAGTKLQEQGDLLITHWGLSGPAVIKLSAWGAEPLNKLNYKFHIIINFLGKSFEQLRSELSEFRSNHPKRKILNYPVANVSNRFWERICEYVGIQQNQTFGEINNKQINKLAEELTQASYEVNGKSTFKEEFVTCGGIDLAEINLETMESKLFPNLYFAGEVLNIDGVTGGFNFQACWSEAWAISENV